jgi:exonuclease VII large subunit
LQMLKSVTATRNPLFPERTKPTITLIHARSQEAQVYADFCQPLRAFDSTVSLQPIPANTPSVPELMHAIRTANVDIIALVRGGGNDEEFSVFENPDLLRAWSEKRAYRVAGIGHSGNSTALHLLSDFAATTPAMAGTHIADPLRTRRDSQQHVAELRAQNDELRMQLRQVQMHHAAQPLTPAAPPRKEIPSQARQNAPTLLRLVLALLIGMLTGAILLPWFPASAMRTAWERNCARHEIGRGHS